MNTDVGVLAEAFPCLSEIVGKTSTAPTQVHFIAAQNRFKFIFQVFFRTIATRAHPLVLFLDDLQWADDLSLQLISALVRDTENNGFLFIGSYRDNEVGPSDLLSTLLHELDSAKVQMTNISVSSISKEDVNTLIADTVNMPQYLSKSLSDIVYQKTSGNALLVIQFLQSLWDEDLLYFSLQSKTWMCDLSEIDEKEITDNVGVLLSGKILQLPLRCQYGMKLLACIGSRCDASTLTSIMAPGKGFKGDNNWKMLDFAVDEGLLKKEGSDYVFVHDQIQQAAYSIIPENERGSLHRQIGYLILGDIPENQVDNLFFTAVSQLNKGKNQLEEDDERLFLQKLNLRAGERAMSLAAFSVAASYLRAGIDLFLNDHWEHHYDLSLQVYNLYAEAEYSICHFEEVGRVVGIVIKAAKSFQDKQRVYATLIKSLGVENKLEEAIQISLSALSQLNVHCPSPLLDKTAFMTAWSEMKGKLENMSDSEFLNSKEMINSDNLAAMKFLHLLLLYTFLSKQSLFPTIVIQSMQLTLRHGVCKESCVTFAYCSYLLIAFQDFKGSEHVARLSVGILEKFKAQEYQSQVYLCIHLGISCYINNLKLNLEPTMLGYQMGMQTGDIQHAMLNAFTHLKLAFISGLNLTELRKSIEKFGKQMIEYKQTTVYMHLLPTKWAVSDLILHTNNKMEQESFMQEGLETNNLIAVTDVCIYGVIVAYIYNNYELAAALMQKRRELEKKMTRITTLYGVIDFYDGLVFLALAHKSSEFEWTSEIRDIMANMEKFASIGKSNNEHKLRLLEAEMKSRIGEEGNAIEQYKLAIAASEKNGFIHEQAIANERAADFFLRNGNKSKASRYYGEANNLYLRWGAQGKADELCKSIPF